MYLLHNVCKLQSCQRSRVRRGGRPPLCSLSSAMEPTKRLAPLREGKLRLGTSPTRGKDLD